MKEKITIVIPVYNVESYLPRCLDSIISQDYENLEIILIDDGSSDLSNEICDKYAENDNRIIVRHQRNKGAANAKNEALRIASGDYLAFADADDYVEPGAYSQMVAALKEHDADVVQGNFRFVYTNRDEDHTLTEYPKEYDTIEYLKRYTVDWTCALLWNKLYKRHLFQNIFFEEGHIIDDEFFTYQGIMNAKRIVCIPQIVYNYRKRKSSVTSVSSYQARIILDKLEYLEKRRKNVIGRFPELKQVFENHYLEMILFLVKDPYITEKEILFIKKVLNAFFDEKVHHRISLSLQIDVKMVQHCSTKVLLKQRKPVEREEQLLADYYD